MAIEHMRLSSQPHEQLIRLKRYTGIEHWNVLCRWAFCRSVAQSNVLPPSHIPADSNVEMSWKVFGGRHHALYMALLNERCLRGGLGVEDDVFTAQLRLHLHRCIAYVANDRQVRGGVAAFMAHTIA